ncbi:hypothetical protein LAD59_20475 [Klebsiella pneumoniae]|nr:hypothetical protein [Klebsiella pneumoniae]
MSLNRQRASIDIDALLQNTWLQVISLRHGPQFRDEGGTRYGSAVLLMSSACNMS